MVTLGGMGIDILEWAKVFSPAFAVATFAYLINFFGKVIVDQIPYLDDRGWGVRLHGTMFMAHVLPAAALGVWLAMLSPWGSDTFWLHLVSLVSLLLVVGVTGCHMLVESSKVYNSGTKKLQELDKQMDGLLLFCASIGGRTGVGVLAGVLFYFGTLEYLSQNIFCTALSSVLIFSSFVLSAVTYSLRFVKDVAPVDIYFADSNTKPLRGVKLLKMGDEIVRVRSGNSVLLLKKNDIQKVEMEMSDATL